MPVCDMTSPPLGLHRACGNIHATPREHIEDDAARQLQPRTVIHQWREEKGVIDFCALAHAMRDLTHRRTGGTAGRRRMQGSSDRVRLASLLPKTRPEVAIRRRRIRRSVMVIDWRLQMVGWDKTLKARRVRRLIRQLV